VGRKVSPLSSIDYIITKINTYLIQYSHLTKYRIQIAEIKCSDIMIIYKI